MITPPFNLQQWIAEHRDKLKPPVNNQVVWTDSEFIVMVVGGPNQRADYHVNQGEELFYQIEGTMQLHVIDEGEFRTIPIHEGELFRLPPAVPHRPQRFENTLGLVLERQRQPGELDAFQWYCGNCAHKVYEETIQLKNIVTQLPEIFQRFYAQPRHCPSCSTLFEDPLS